MTSTSYDFIKNADTPENAEYDSPWLCSGQ